MSSYCFLDFAIQFERPPKEVVSLYVQGSIEQSLTQVFGEIGGNTSATLLKFDSKRCQGILRVPEISLVKLRAALTLIAQFQNIPCKFIVRNSSAHLINLIPSKFA